MENISLTEICWVLVSREVVGVRPINMLIVPEPGFSNRCYIQRFKQGF